MSKRRNSEVLSSLAAQVLSGMIANPHIYSMVSDEGASGEQEKILRHTALEIAEALIIDAENRDE
ncbi:hypothetical protein [Crocosphaera chwakensis]|uniref:Bifunctional phosphopantothenoylcysteine decarboxylase/phosphopantothenate synthase n=1 Tax=Crocosphaera chwakensis CCY0110 TaxID=391612 RepID=A3ING6_9CHRO|nr:hypothetical protein [Crocosphaera chwakensis]EAZ91864.1 bifunctional phosphopantothenoylcysteine decarboxylase/phosphopantothenate synthase [Crocosphaera chwakensis CCY0110]